MITHDIASSLGMDGDGQSDNCPQCGKEHRLYPEPLTMLVCGCGCTLIIQQTEEETITMGIWQFRDQVAKSGEMHFNDLPYTN